MTPEQLAALVADHKRIARHHAGSQMGDRSANTADAIEHLQVEVAFLKTCGVIELMVRNPNVDSYVKEWEARATKADAEVARLSTAPDDAEVAALVEAYRSCAKSLEHQPGLVAKELRRHHEATADALTRLSHALADEKAKREAMEEALAKVAGFQGRFKMPFPEAHEEYPAYVVVLARETLAKHGSK